MSDNYSQDITTTTAPIRPLAHVVQNHVVNTLRACDGNKARACRVLGIGRRTLDLMLYRWGIDRAWRTR